MGKEGLEKSVLFPKSMYNTPEAFRQPGSTSTTAYCLGLVLYWQMERLDYFY